MDANGTMDVEAFPEPCACALAVLTLLFWVPVACNRMLKMWDQYTK